MMVNLMGSIDEKVEECKVKNDRHFRYKNECNNRKYLKVVLEGIWITDLL